MVKLLIFILINAISLGTFADINLSTAIEEKINQVDPNLNIGIKITNLDKNQVVFEKNADRYFIPASTLKFITIVSLLEHFGLDYKFTNKLFNIGTNYYLDIHDPDFKHHELDSMIASIIGHNGQIIQGNIYISNKQFTVPAIIRDKTYSDTTYCNAGPITKVHINKNCSKLNVVGLQIGHKVNVTVPNNFPYIVENNATTVGKSSLDRLHVQIKDKQFIINGTLSTSSGRVVIGGVANDNLQQVKSYLKKRLAKHGITLKGKILYGTAPQNAKEIATFSKSITTIASIAIKKSDNFITDYLLAEFATQKNQHEWRRATASLKNLVKKEFNVDLEKSIIQDGSGISRVNLITINQHSNFLKSVAKKSNFKTITTLMAKSGEDGTLEKRFKDIPKLYAKTGTLGNVSNIIGYFYDTNDDLHSFVIMANNFYGNSAPYRQLEEDIIKLAAGIY
ncbi:MAG: D-alanyl-D-alanine carboxypeptidase/D-alanyl-D-alanine-endopeptidase [Rickettsiaceae bacterium]|nr:D-alanyl-D-alanine carboxypeptidase/D-alanyl-D-alanine-endopeptidase [Rickettsiaceae bacterium]MDP5020194.1 D-alanyl-D-alanine carboxypeptidase/D-alanyl-D-alanine-endopeptidase [Rickettsiaceae bacterium]MDP5082910.1 D-alanyl-D-alanine carboxypeptidase/D-alanyl-D-alanine-endopeptidase [Rickettsiaceae bacterium]